MRNSKLKSYLFVISAMLIFGTIGIFRRNISITPAMLAVSRGFIGAVFLMAFVKIRGGKIFGGIGVINLILLIVSGACIGLNWILLFGAFDNTSVSTATLCYYMEPTIVIFASALFFRERLNARKLICAGLAVVGMTAVSGILSGEGVSGKDTAGILLGLAAAFVYSAVVLLNKLIKIGDPYQKTAIQILSAAVAMLPYLLITEDFSAVNFDARSVIFTVVMGVVHTALGYALYFAGMTGLNAQSVALLSYVDPVSALILSGIILKEQLTPVGIIGAVLIIGSAIVSELEFKRRKNE